MIEGQNTYFASINTTKGFISFFQNIFDPSKLEKVYILKGGPGTGKSSLIKSVASWAEKMELEYDLFLCSSDPNSLDAILLPQSRIAIVDGTAPHVTDPLYPGVVENIVNLGSFWKSDKLKENKSEILSLIKEKSRHYKQAYQFLSSYGEIAKEILYLSQQALLTDKLEKNIHRQAKYFFNENTDCTTEMRNVATVCGDSIVQTRSFVEKATRIWIIEDQHFSSHLYLGAMRDYALSKKQNVWISTSPLLPDYPNALFFPDSGTAMVLGTKNDDSQKVYRFINMKRFLNQEFIHGNKQKLKFGEKCLKMLLTGASDSFANARVAHQKLEHFYTSAMDFKQVENTRQILIKEIFS